MHLFHYHNDSLFCESVGLEDLARQYGTPLYVYSANTIRENLSRLRGALPSLRNQVCYAVKANSNLAILKLLAAEGAGFDIVSAGELFRVLKAGGKASACTFAGVGKTKGDIEYALREGIHCFNVESEAELEAIDRIAAAQGRKAPIAIRVNPDVEADTHHYITTGKSQNKFGIGLERALQVYEAADSLKHLAIKGVQTHIGSQVHDVKPFAEAVAKLTPLVQELHGRHGLEFFSIGGGIGIVYEQALASGRREWWEKQSGHLTAEAYGEALLPLLKPLNLRILLEPGRFLVGNAGALVCSALYVKKTPSKTFLIIDGAMNDLIRPALYQGWHEIIPLDEPSASADWTEKDVVGPVCESGDFYAQSRSLPDIQPGERLAVLSAGAYGFSMASTYNSRPLAAEVLVDGSSHRLVRQRQTFEDLIRGESA